MALLRHIKKAFINRTQKSKAPTGLLITYIRKYKKLTKKLRRHKRRSVELLPIRAKYKCCSLRWLNRFIDHRAEYFRYPHIPNCFVKIVCYDCIWKVRYFETSAIVFIRGEYFLSIKSCLLSHNGDLEVNKCVYP
jgi:hypothetical protein